MVDAEQVVVRGLSARWRRRRRVGERVGRQALVAEERLLGQAAVQYLDRLRVLALEEVQALLELRLERQELVGREGGLGVVAA